MNIAQSLHPSVLRDRLEELELLYRRADEAVSVFQAKTGLSCPFGCGSCCEAFVPDILPLEAEYLAAFLALKNPEQAYALAARGLEERVREDGRRGCPLYADDTPYHCTVYEARPLICRLFAFSAVRDKRGQPSFALCRLMPEPDDAIADMPAGEGAPADAPGDVQASAQASAPAGEGAPLREALRLRALDAPLMADYGGELASIDPASAGERDALPEALTKALGKLLFLVGLDNERDPEKGGPDLSPPLPSAG
jgi:Fe-S-cluster containining protein